MFQIDLPSVPYSDPWTIPLHKRIKELLRGKKRVAYFYECANNSTFRYRAYNMVQVLNENQDTDISASYFFLEDLNTIHNLADLADILVICRSLYNHRINHLITQFHALKKQVLFDVDDLVFNTKYAHLIMNTLNVDMGIEGQWNYWYSYLSRLGETLRLCDGAITTNSYLAARIFEYADIPTHIVPNFINKEQFDISKKLFHYKKSTQFARNDKICFGYFSGSPSHNLDYEIITSALAEILDKNTNVEVMVAGYIEAGPILRRFGNRIKYSPFHDYVNLQRLISTVEFNLMPLQSNIFTNCKSELKYFEAAIVGTLSIASPTYTYARAIQDGENGYIAQTHQWTEVMQRAIDNIDMYQNMAESAYADAFSKYAWSEQRNTIIQALDFV